jgi:hypothetical protein
VWALQEPIDQRLLRCDYSDIAVLGKAVTRGPGWRPAGLAIHALNGAVFGLAFHEARRVLPVGSRKLALRMALTEHICLSAPSSTVTTRRAVRSASHRF